MQVKKQQLELDMEQQTGSKLGKEYVKAACLFNSERLYFWGSQITTDGDCSHKITRHLLLGRKAMTSLDSTLKSRHVTLPAKVHLVKAMVFPVVMYECES